MKVSLLLSLAFGVLLAAGCSRGKAPPPPTTSATEIIERVGEVAILPLDAPAFENLTVDEKKAAYFLSQAVLAGRDIVYDQIYPRQAASRRFLDKISVHIDYGAPEYFVTPFRATLKSIWLQHGVYDLNTGRKIKPAMESRELYQLMFVALANSGGRLGHLKDINLMAQFIADTLLNPALDSISTVSLSGLKRSLSYPPNGFYENLAVPGEPRREGALLGQFDQKYPHNSKLTRRGEELVELVYRAGDEEVAPGLFAEELDEVIKNLEKGRLYLPANRVSVVDLLSEHFRSGNWALYDSARQLQRSAAAPVDFVLGFNDRRFDPLHQKGLWTGLVFISDKPAQDKIDRLLQILPELQKDLPLSLKTEWHPTHPIRAVQLLTASGAISPLCPDVYYDPPYFEGVEKGYQGLIFTNVITAQARARVQSVKLDFFEEPVTSNLQERYAEDLRLTRVVLNEVISLDENMLGLPRNQDRDSSGYVFLSQIARLWLLGHPALVTLGLLPDTTAQELAYRFWVEECLKSLANPEWNFQREIDQSIAGGLMQAGSLILTQKEGKTYTQIPDVRLLREHLVELGKQASRLLEKGSAEELRAYYAMNAALKRPELQDEIRQRCQSVGDFFQVAYLMPLVKAQYNPMGGLEKVTLKTPQDFTEEMLIYGGLNPTPKQKNN